MLKGVLRAGGRTVPVEGRVLGEEITLTTGSGAGTKTWHGRKKGNTLELK
jgi:hypothetical protein